MTSRERAEAIVVQADREMHITKPLTLAGFIQRAIEEAVAEAVKAERKACWLECLEIIHVVNDDPSVKYPGSESAGIIRCVEAIRARGDK